MYSNEPRLSVNVNKIALLRNARGGNLPDLIKVALDCERFGAQGITVHPRPDERHIRQTDVYMLSPVVQTEFNIEGYPSKSFIEMVGEVKPHQVTLVPDPPGALTSSEGWNTIEHQGFLKEVVERLHRFGCRVSLFLEPREDMLDGALKTGTERIEFYTGPYAAAYTHSREAAVEPYVKAGKYATGLGLGINAGHDLNLENLAFFRENVPSLLEVSIGQALVCDALYYGLENTIQMYLRALGH